jgi:primosomal protein N'
VYSSKDPEKAQKAAEDAEKRLNEFIDRSGVRRDVIQMRAVEAPIKLLRGLTRWQVFLKMYFKGDLDGVTREMQSMADSAPQDVQAELEINPSNLF